MTDDSFNIGNPEIAENINSADRWGLKVIHYHMLAPQKRARTQQIPFRDGSYDYGYVDEYYNDRPLEVFCKLTRRISEDEFDEIRSALSRPLNIYFWDRPDKYYTAKLYDAIPVTVYQQHAMREFTLSFMCAPPFAIGPQVIQPISDGMNPVQFKGTARTPTLIILKNTSGGTIQGITITAARRIN